MSDISNKFFEDKLNGALWDVAVSIKRGNPLPLDKDAVVHNLSELEALKTSPVTYPGQIVAVIADAVMEGDVVKTPESTTLYYFDHNLEYHEVGKVPVGDEKSIEVNADGMISLLGASAAANGTLPMIGESGKLEWKTLEDIGAGDGNDNTTYEITALEKGEGEAAEAYGIKIQVKENGVASGDPIEIPLDVYTKSEVDATVGDLDDRIKALEEAEDADTTYSVKEGEKILKLEGTEFSTVASLKYVEATEEETAKIQLLGIDNAVVSEIDATPFIRDGMLNDVEYDAESNTLTFIWNTAAGEKSDTVVLSDIIEPYTAGNGLELSGNEFAIKVDTESEDFLTVGEAGLKLAGVQQAIDDAKNAALTEVANNYYNKTEVYKKDEVYNKTEVYAKNEVYTKGEADQAIADKISEVNGGESAGEVLGQLNAYKKTVNMEVWGDENGTGDENGNSRIDLLDAKVDALEQVGAQANVIESVKVNGATLPITEKAVDITVPTALSQLEGYTALDERVTAAKSQADKGVDEAGKAAAAAATNAEAITALTQRVEPLEAAKNDHSGRLIALENAKGEHDAAYNALVEIVNGHSASIATKAEQTTVDGISAKAAANEAAIKTINETTIPGINSEIAKKADADKVYTKTEVNNIVGTPTEGKTVIDMIADAQAAATYDDTAIRALITAETERATGVENGLNGRLETVEDFFKAVETPDEVIDTLAEIVSYIESDKSGASAMAGSIKANTDAIALINDSTNGILAKANKYTDDAIAGLPFATAAQAGIVKSTNADNGVAVAADGTMSVNRVSTSKLFVPEGEELILNGGSANLQV